MRQIENQLESIIQEIVSRCRTASSARNQTRKMQSTLEHIQSAYELAGSGYLKAADARNLIEKALKNVQRRKKHWTQRIRVTRTRSLSSHG